MICNKSLISSTFRENGIDPDATKETKSIFAESISTILGFISAFFAIGFFIALFNDLFLRDEISLIILGLIISGGVFYFIKQQATESNHFIDALLVSAQGLIIFGLTTKLHNHNIDIILTIVVEVIYIYIFDIRVSQFLASFIATSALISLFLLNKMVAVAYVIPFIISIFVTLKYHSSNLSPKYRAILTGVVISLAMSLFFKHNLGYYLHKYTTEYHILEAIVLAILVVYITHFRARMSPKNSITILLILSPLIVLSVWINAFAISLGYLILGFVFGLFTLFEIGILGVIASISIWYYNLEITLTQKSFLMMGVGVVLIFIGVLINLAKRRRKDG